MAYVRVIRANFIIMQREYGFNFVQKIYFYVINYEEVPFLGKTCSSWWRTTKFHLPDVKIYDTSKFVKSFVNSVELIESANSAKKLNQGKKQ